MRRLVCSRDVVAFRVAETALKGESISLVWPLISAALHNPRSWTVPGQCPKEGLAFRSKRSMCVFIARLTMPRATMGRPDALIRPGLVSVRGLD